MADIKITDKIPAQSISYIVLCAAGLLILFLGGVVPAYRTINNLNNEISVLGRRAEERKALTSLFVSLQKQREQKEPETLPLPARTNLPPDKLDTLHPVFRKAAAKSGLSLVSTVPELGALAGNTQYIPVTVVLRGNTGALRKFIIEIGALPYIDHIEKMEIQAGPKDKEFKLNIQIAVG
jgi:Tfp pilus assembly protein PilO